jgi:hypothetical protein
MSASRRIFTVVPACINGSCGALSRAGIAFKSQARGSRLQSHRFQGEACRSRCGGLYSACPSAFLHSRQHGRRFVANATHSVRVHR